MSTRFKNPSETLILLLKHHPDDESPASYICQHNCWVLIPVCLSGGEEIASSQGPKPQKSILKHKKPTILDQLERMLVDSSNLKTMVMKRCKQQLLPATLMIPKAISIQLVQEKLSLQCVTGYLPLTNRLALVMLRATWSWMAQKVLLPQSLIQTWIHNRKPPGLIKVIWTQFSQVKHMLPVIISPWALMPGSLQVSMKR